MFGCRIRRISVGALGCSSVVVVLLLAACSDSGGNAVTGGTAVSSGVNAVSGGSGVSGSTTSLGSVTVTTNVGALGVYLVDGAGRTLYMFDADTGSVSACYDACAGVWPPFTITGSPTAGENAAGGELSTLTRSDGSRQVVYGVHPLYYFAEDTAPGQTSGEGSDGKWWVVGRTGDPIKVAGPSSTTANTTR
jgi:predicted lipoprotein with Yx(FWY)xxD motif